VTGLPDPLRPGVTQVRRSLIELAAPRDLLIMRWAG
jgi:hypothetical protein